MMCGHQTRLVSMQVNQHCPSVAPWSPAPWLAPCSPAQIWPNPIDIPQKSPGHGPGDCPEQMDKATSLWGATRVCRGVKQEGGIASNLAQHFHVSLPAGAEFEPSRV